MEDSRIDASSHTANMKRSAHLNRWWCIASIGHPAGRLLSSWPLHLYPPLLLFHSPAPRPLTKEVGGRGSCIKRQRRQRRMRREAPIFFVLPIGNSDGDSRGLKMQEGLGEHRCCCLPAMAKYFPLCLYLCYVLICSLSLTPFGFSYGVLSQAYQSICQYRIYFFLSLISLM
jgi:hypothetical protein